MRRIFTKSEFPGCSGDESGPPVFISTRGRFTFPRPFASGGTRSLLLVCVTYLCIKTQTMSDVTTKENFVVVLYNFF